jgi:transcription antitermination factor NusG
MQDVVVPALGSYVFTRVEPVRGDELRSVPGIRGFVRDRASGGPAQVPDTVVAELLSRAPTEVLPAPERPCGFRPGERVIVHGSGLIAGHAGVFQQAINGEHAVIEQEWLGRTVSVTVRLDEISKVEKRNKRRRRRRRGKASPRNGNGELILAAECPT